MWRLITWQNHLFARWYPSICRANGWGGPSYGSEEHMEFVWGQLRLADCFHHKRGRVKSARWYSIVDIYAKKRSDLPIVGMVCMYMGMVENWWAGGPPYRGFIKVDEPTVRVVEAPPTDAIASADIDAKPLTVQESNAEVANERARVKNSVQLVADFCAEESKLRGVDAMMLALAPTHERSVASGNRYGVGLSATSSSA